MAVTRNWMRACMCETASETLVASVSVNKSYIQKKLFKWTLPSYENSLSLSPSPSASVHLLSIAVHDDLYQVQFSIFVVK